MCGALLWWVPMMIVCVIEWVAVHRIVWPPIGWMDGGKHQLLIAIPSGLLMMALLYFPMKRNSDREDREFDEFMTREFGKNWRMRRQS
jgi:hypothetical protein